LLPVSWQEQWDWNLDKLNSVDKNPNPQVGDFKVFTVSCSGQSVDWAQSFVHLYLRPLRGMGRPTGVSCCQQGGICLQVFLFICLFLSFSLPLNLGPRVNSGFHAC
jgi:hypothetical protein